MAEYAILKVREKTKKATLRLAKKHEMNILDFTQSMVEYFDHTGLHPREKEVLKPAEELKALRNTIISFFRTQEKEYVLPVFTKMDVLIGRFMQYLDEEAPKIDGSKPSSFSVKSEITKDDKTESKVTVESESKSSSDELKKLKNEYERLKLKYDTTLGYLNNIIENTENKSTGLSKAPVISLSMVEINDIKKSLKKIN